MKKEENINIYEVSMKRDNETLKKIINKLSPDNIKKFEKVNFLLEKEIDGDANGLPRFRIEKFILSDEEFPTPESKLRQCHLELGVRKSALESHRYLIKKKLIEIKKFEIDLNSLTSVTNLSDNEKLDILEIENEIYHLSNIVNDRINDVKRLTNESEVYLEKMMELKKEVNCSMEEYLSNPKYEREFWNKKYKQKSLGSIN